MICDRYRYIYTELYLLMLTYANLYMSHGLIVRILARVSEIGTKWTTQERGFWLINTWYNDPWVNRYYFGPKTISLYRVFAVHPTPLLRTMIPRTMPIRHTRKPPKARQSKTIPMRTVDAITPTALENTYCLTMNANRIVWI